MARKQPEGRRQSSRARRQPERLGFEENGGDHDDLDGYDMEDTRPVTRSCARRLRGREVNQAEEEGRENINENDARPTDKVEQGEETVPTPTTSRSQALQEKNAVKAGQKRRRDSLLSGEKSSKEVSLAKDRRHKSENADPAEPKPTQSTKTVKRKQKGLVKHVTKTYQKVLNEVISSIDAQKLSVVEHDGDMGSWCVCNRGFVMASKESYRCDDPKCKVVWYHDVCLSVLDRKRCTWKHWICLDCFEHHLLGAERGTTLHKGIAGSSNDLQTRLTRIVLQRRRAQGNISPETRRMYQQREIDAIDKQLEETGRWYPRDSEEPGEMQKTARAWTSDRTTVNMQMKPEKGGIVVTFEYRLGLKLIFAPSEHQRLVLVCKRYGNKTQVDFPINLAFLFSRPIRQVLKQNNILVSEDGFVGSVVLPNIDAGAAQEAIEFLKGKTVFASLSPTGLSERGFDALFQISSFAHMFGIQKLQNDVMHAIWMSVAIRRHKFEAKQIQMALEKTIPGCPSRRFLERLLSDSTNKEEGIIATTLDALPTGLAGKQLADAVADILVFGNDHDSDRHLTKPMIQELCRNHGSCSLWFRGRITSNWVEDLRG